MIIISSANICFESSMIFRNSLNSEFHDFVRVKLTLKFGTHLIRKIQKFIFRSKWKINSCLEIPNTRSRLPCPPPPYWADPIRGGGLTNTRRCKGVSQEYMNAINANSHIWQKALHIYVPNWWVTCNFMVNCVNFWIFRKSYVASFRT